MSPSPSPSYKFAKNPRDEIRRAVCRQLEERSDNPRVTWQALCKSASSDIADSLELPVLCQALKYFGTGIQLTPDDLEIAFDSPEPVDFARFKDLIARN